MTQHNINIEVYMGISKKPITTWGAIITTDTEIDKYGAIWGEREVLQLGAHFNKYRRQGKGRKIKNTIIAEKLLGTPKVYQSTPHKLPGSSVTGNFGEVITILALQSRVPEGKMGISHLCPKKGYANLQCPDLLVASTPLVADFNYYFSQYQASLFTQEPPPSRLPKYIPVECKNLNVKGAISQIFQYWKQIRKINSVFGFGLISSIDYRNGPILKLYLLIRRSSDDLASFLDSQADFKKVKWIDIEGLFYV